MIWWDKIRRTQSHVRLFVLKYRRTERSIKWCEADPKSIYYHSFIIYYEFYDLLHSFQSRTDTMGHITTCRWTYRELSPNQHLSGLWHCCFISLSWICTHSACWTTTAASFTFVTIVSRCFPTIHYLLSTKWLVNVIKHVAATVKLPEKQSPMNLKNNGSQY